MATTILPMRSGNPALSDATFRTIGRVAAGHDAMTIEGTVNKTGLSLLLLVVAASYTWNLGLDNPRVIPLVTVGIFGGFIMAIATVFKKTWAPWTTPAYAVLEGLALGGISVAASKPAIRVW